MYEINSSDYYAKYVKKDKKKAIGKIRWPYNKV